MASPTHAIAAEMAGEDRDPEPGGAGDGLRLLAKQIFEDGK